MIRSTRYLLALLVLAATATLAACGTSREPSGAIEAASPGTPGHPIEVTTSAVVERDVPLVVQATGAFVADEVSNVAPEMAGIVAATPVDIGDRVAAGAVIARLKHEDATLRLEQARAGLLQAEAAAAQARERYNLARANAARYDALVATGDVSRTLQEQAATEAATTQQGVFTAEAAIADARSRVALAQKALDDTVIRAPFAGFITERPAAVGEYVSTSSTVATVMKLDPIRLRLQVPELEAARLEVGQAVSATVEALDNRQFDGKVTAINPALDPATRATIVEAMIANPGGAIRSGMFATAQVALGTTERGLFVPRAAVVDDPNTNSFRAFTVSEGTARLRIVQPAVQPDGQVRVLSGVAAGDQVAVAGLEQLFDGAAVRPVSR
ncbi:MAG: efflux RND transporter periplasmic adaptor subunit [Vicinamibacterales bacterium]